MVSKRHEDLKQISREISGNTEPVPLRPPAESPSTPKSVTAPVAKSTPVDPVPAASVESTPTSSNALSRSAKGATSSGFANRHRPRRVACFHCDGSLEVSYAAKNATCPLCKEPINLNDYEINKPVLEDVFTRGNVTINKLGSLECESLVCHHLKAYGNLQALVHSTGDVMIRSRAKLPGGLSCKKLLVGRDAVVEVDGEVYVEELEVDGVISATGFVCLGTTRIEQYGAINGPLKTCAVSMEDGGALNGALQIISMRNESSG